MFYHSPHGTDINLLEILLSYSLKIREMAISGSPNIGKNCHIVIYEKKDFKLQEPAILNNSDCSTTSKPDCKLLTKDYIKTHRWMNS